MKKKLDPNKYNSFKGIKNDSPKSEQKEKIPDEIDVKFDISWKAIVKVIGTILAILFAQKIFLVIVIFFFAFVLMSALLPIVNFLRSKGLPKLISILLSYGLVISLLLFVAVTISRPVVTEFVRLSENLPDAIEIVVSKIGEYLESIPFVVVDMNSISKFITSQLFSTGGNGVDWTLLTISGFGSLISSFFIGLIISIYFMFDHDHYLDFVLERIQDEHRMVLVKELIGEVERKLGNWFFTQGLLMLIISIMTFIMLMLIGVEFAIPLSIMSGLFGLIPTIGPVVAGIIVMLFALIFNGLGPAIAVLIGSVLIQQIDNAFITPRLMSNVSGISPVLILMGVMIGFSLGGIVGAILAVPVLVVVKIGSDFYMKFRKLNKADL